MIVTSILDNVIFGSLLDSFLNPDRPALAVRADVASEDN